MNRYFSLSLERQAQRQRRYPVLAALDGLVHRALSLATLFVAGFFTWVSLMHVAPDLPRLTWFFVSRALGV